MLSSKQILQSFGDHVVHITIPAQSTLYLPNQLMHNCDFWILCSHKDANMKIKLLITLVVFET
jgi:hypothetical protein